MVGVWGAEGCRAQTAEFGGMPTAGLVGRTAMECGAGARGALPHRGSFWAPGMREGGPSQHHSPIQSIVILA